MKNLLLLIVLLFGVAQLQSQSKKELQRSLIVAQQENEILTSQIETLKKELAETKARLEVSEKNLSLIKLENKNLKDKESSAGSGNETLKTNTPIKSEIKTSPSTNKSSNTSQKSSYSTPTGDGRIIHTGPRGGRYYLTSSGKKVYVK